jgi:hypothetical protein
MTRRLARAAGFFRERYFTVDTRTLGLFRICFGLHLIANLYDRTKGSDAIAFYTNLGVLPNHYALFAPMGERIWSLLFPFSTTAEVQVAFVCILLVYAAYTLGYRTKLMQILVVVCLLSLDNRNLALQNGGIVVTNVVAVWTAFLPLGARFSIDHLRRSLAERPEANPADLEARAAMVRSQPSVSRLAFFGILLNFACIYFFNYAHKQGVTWKDGSAVHWVLWQNRIATIWAALLRMHEPRWLSPVATWGTLAIEASLPVFLLSPFFHKWARRLALAGIFALHGGISLMMTLGPFSYSMMSFALLLIGKEDWDFVQRLFRQRGPRLLVVYDPSWPRLHEAARIAARLDGRRALEFVSRRELEPARAAVPEALADRPLVVFEPQSERWTTDGDAVKMVLRALPLGFAYAWLLSPAFARRWAAERIVGSRGANAQRSRRPPKPDAPAARFARSVVRVLGESMAAVLFATILSQVGTDNWAIPDAYRVKHRPAFMHELVEYLRLPQGWSMFSPDAPRDDGTLVIDAVLSDGRHLDPRKQAPPDFEAAYHGPWYDDQQWCDWDLRMKWEGNRHFYPYFQDYIARLDHLTSWKQAATIRSFDVYWVNNAAPPPGSVQPYGLTRQLLFSSAGKP